MHLRIFRQFNDKLYPILLLFAEVDGKTMSLLKLKFTLFLLVIAFLAVDVEGSASRISRTVRGTMRVIGLGPWCVGCPAHYCDDDINIIQGYCCGCASFIDKLPVKCHSSVKCSMNIYELCLKYEYMMHCCC
ncbi:uncharacterized protein LOC109536875 [Dendroctonus ponderosae]|uniref:Uncharacterized protein n=1 Tax=Dendroctonus ponderosae TaxID=77166 RepID=A0AAR5PCT2_DENPD|nr:uncharacterized protein LOC109536875 [Dendroctonus ponderosae]KAH1015330.1 hypothetical protein HUJ05_013079 [Dendroctonus ponderosae]